jgi:hypothetical protein
MWTRRRRCDALPARRANLAKLGLLLVAALVGGCRLDLQGLGPDLPESGPPGRDAQVATPDAAADSTPAEDGNAGADADAHGADASDDRSQTDLDAPSDRAFPADVCSAGRADCNASTAPNTDGCECATPSCCGTACETKHDDGFGHPFYDCNPPSATSSQAALAACNAYAASFGGSASDCSDGWSCPNTDQVCYAPSSGCAKCWNYTGPMTGAASDCNCPPTQLGTWD